MPGWNGKVLGGIFGGLAGGPVGAALGVLLGHQYDQYAGPNASHAGAHRVQQLFLPATFRLLGHVAKSDGRVSEREIAAARALMRSLRLGTEQEALAIGYFTDGKRADFELAASLRPLRDALTPYPQLAQFFIELQLQTALLGNDLAAQPRERIRYAANFLGLSVQHFAQLEALLRWRQQSAANGGARAGASGNAAEPEATPQRIAEAYGLLECKANDRDEQVVKAYRRQMSKHHPDKLQANGLPESMLERAKERTQQIQAAYELIRRARGMS